MIRTGGTTMSQHKRVNVTEWHYVWLKVLAIVWSERPPYNFKNSLLNPGSDGVRKVIGDKLMAVLNQQKIDMGLPDIIDLKVIDDVTKLKRPAGWKPEWMPEVGFWSLPDTEVTVKLPDRPDGDTALALADLADRTSFVGIAADGSSFVRATKKSRTKGTKSAARKGLRQATEETPDVELEGYEEPITAFEQMTRWFSVWPKAVAQAWKENGRNRPFTRHLIKDANAALHNAFGFDVPGGVRLIVERGPQYKLGMKPPHIEVTLFLPPKPSGTYDGPIAIAAYSESGRSFPFTLCTMGC
jgi:hypothetical protein